MMSHSSLIRYEYDVKQSREKKEVERKQVDPLTSSTIYRGLGALVQLMKIIIHKNNLLGN